MSQEELRDSVNRFARGSMLIIVLVILQLVGRQLPQFKEPILGILGLDYVVTAAWLASIGVMFYFYKSVQFILGFILTKLFRMEDEESRERLITSSGRMIILLYFFIIYRFIIYVIWTINAAYFNQANLQDGLRITEAIVILLVLLIVLAIAYPIIDVLTSMITSGLVPAEGTTSSSPPTETIGPGEGGIKCTKCGSVEQEDASFCGSCGNPLEKDEVEVAETTTDE